MHQELREELAKVKTLEGVTAVNQELKLRCQAGDGAGGAGGLPRQKGTKPPDPQCPGVLAGGHFQAEGGREALRRLAFLPLDLPALLPARVS